jgi:hypothetical protein
MMIKRVFSSSPVGRAARAWLFGGLFALLLAGGWLAGPAQVQNAYAQSVPLASTFLPLLHSGEVRSNQGCPLQSTQLYRPVSIFGDPRPALPAPVDDPDLNLTMRGYTATVGIQGLIDLGGDTHGDPPQLAQLFRPPRAGAITALYQVYDWNWSGVCAQSAEEPGCRGVPLVEPPVTTIALATTRDEPLYLPGRREDIAGGVYRALVLYAEETRLTVGYTRDDSVAPGYVLHLENLCVDANLLALYQQLHQAGRHELPGLQLDVPVGTSRGDTVLLAMRDKGSFMDPRSRKDWWQGY